ncbi:Conserved hypothetical protein [Clostridium acetobutylicum EA 2018]|uniref:EF-hand domain-containing protein n=1 Tax=Clostridium acetobutylicum (strain ATCC 824 / DSM 792 / JCM 1419 / IAM 19013 / LMG 5710 / NBRC 13948 / NRRL B-527 / VKM B-1787 / 2291 / W) TaxID=272562 RepID=Q97KU9_CLOAB|nr:Hypothetical protein CA_C0817 [Clostridium acetobutylicum ATCC 824]ADZ19867.1 Conserved hypothetical protein [Clostridium acetobutylicum EA 2018]AEI31455.1 hypothetical protein SMB_G0833 [Clostridium acetobutylicum DSM 1731]AWV80511.1 hypothetical protein DK921_10480 [Clostridium acetobutylicum]PSM06314.1 hypothetical protein C7T89_10475 [Clostridium sp. NJ4]
MLKLTFKVNGDGKVDNEDLKIIAQSTTH